MPEETPDDAGETVSGISVQGEGEPVDIQDQTATHSILIVEDDEEPEKNAFKIVCFGL